MRTVDQIAFDFCDSSDCQVLKHHKDCKLSQAIEEYTAQATKDLKLQVSQFEKLDDYEAKIVKMENALEDIVCMQHLHEGNGGCHGPCPICRAAQALGLHKYLNNEGDKQRLQSLKEKHGYGA